VFPRPAPNPRPLVVIVGRPPNRQLLTNKKQVTKEEINMIDISTIDNQMVEIPSGKIELKDDRTKERWTVEIKPILLAKFPVTQELYFAITNEEPSTIKGNRHPVETVTWKEVAVGLTKNEV